MTGYVADLSWKSGARAIEKLDRLRSTMAVNVLTPRDTSYGVGTKWTSEDLNQEHSQKCVQNAGVCVQIWPK